MNKLYLILIFSILLIGTISAVDWDNSLSYSNNDLKVTVKNIWGLPVVGSDLGTAELKSHKTVNEVRQVIYGNRVVMWYDFDYKEIYFNGLGQVEFRDMNTGKIVNKEWYYVKAIYGNVPYDIQECKEVEHLNENGKGISCEVVRTEMNREIIGWERLDSKDIPKGENTIGIMVNVEDGDYTDGIWTISGKKITRHAVWTSDFNVGLNAYYPYNGTGAGTNVEDVVYHNNNLTAQGNVIWKEGIINASLYHDGTGDYEKIDAPSFNLTQTTNFTISFWMNHTGAQTYEGIIAQGTTDPSNYFEVNTGSSAGKFNFLASINCGNWDGFNADFTMFPSESVWYHFIVRRENNNYSFWTNGVCKYSQVTVGTICLGSQRLLLGDRAGGGRALKGSLDEIGIWNRSLTTSEISDLYNSGTGISYIPNQPPTSGTLIITTTLVNPTEAYSTINTNFSFYANATATWGNLTNMTLYVYNPDNSIFLKNYTNSITGTNNQTNFTNVIISSLGTSKWNVYTCGFNDTLKTCSFANSNRTFTLNGFSENSKSFNSSTYEGFNESYQINISYSGISYPSVNATLNYDGVNYSTTGLGGSGEMRFVSNFIVPVTSANRSFYWIINLNGVTGISNTNYQYVNSIVFNLCNATNNVPYLNITFKDSTSLININATITSTFNYYLNSLVKSFNFVNLTENPSYAFCFNPSYKSINYNISMTYASVGYPQRSYTTTGTLSNSTTNQVLYLLEDGIYSTFQVVNDAGTNLNGVSVTAEESILGVYNTIGSGTTGADGSITFWVNPLNLHRFTFVKSGYDTYSLTLTPTQGLYTISLDSTAGVASADCSQGISYYIRPSESYIWNNTIYNFSYTVSSSYWNLSSFGISVYYGNGTFINSNISTTSTGGIVSITSNVYNYNSSNPNSINKIYMNYYYSTNSTCIINGTRYWIIEQSSYGNQFSINNLINDIGIYTGVGLFGFDNFGRALLCFLVLVLTTGIMTRKYGIASEAAIMGVIFGIVLFLDIGVNWIPELTFGGLITPQPHLVTIITGIILFGTILREELK